MDVSARTLTWMVVTPSIGAIVSATVGMDWGGALVGCGVRVDGNVAVTKSGRITSGVLLSIPTQPEIPIASMKIRCLFFTMDILSIKRHPFERVSLYPRADSNCALRLRRPTLYPLSYGGNARILPWAKKKADGYAISLNVSYEPVYFTCGASNASSFLNVSTIAVLPPSSPILRS